MSGWISAGRIAFILALLPAGIAHSATFIVNTTQDAGDFDLKDGVADSDAKTPGTQVTLRCAIENANLTPAADEIRFDLPASDPGHRFYKDDHVAGDINLASAAAINVDTPTDVDRDYDRTWWAIAPKSALPDITAPLIIDGYSQKGAQQFSKVPASDAVLCIELDGSEASDAAVMAIAQQADPYLPGLHVRADGCTIRGLAVTRYNNNLSPGILIESSNNVVTGCFIGVEPSGLHAKPNFVGVQVTPGSNGAAITDNTIAGNLISGNYRAGVFVLGDVKKTAILGNVIGADRNGAKRLPNGHGVHIAGVASSNRVGGAKSGDGNLIAFNGKDGVLISHSMEQEGADNAVIGNSIHSNVGIGINLAHSPEGTNDVTPNDRGDVDEGPNHLQNFPELTSASTNSFLWFVPGAGGTTIKGTLKTNPDTNYRVELFSNATPDASGYGEGQRLLAFVNVNTGSSRIADIDIKVPMTIPGGHAVSATATEVDATGAFKSTSEFSADVRVEDALPASLWLIVLGAVMVAILLILRAKRARRLPPLPRPAETSAPAA